MGLSLGGSRAVHEEDRENSSDQEQSSNSEDSRQREDREADVVFGDSGSGDGVREGFECRALAVSQDFWQRFFLF